MLPGGPLQAQDASLEYAENRMDPVDTFTGVDPEGRPVYWSLLDALTDPAPTVGGTALEATDIADAGAFTISSDGVLSFKLPPDFEMPMSRPAIGSPVVTVGTLAARNVYKIVVVASDDARGADMVGEADLGAIDGIENIQKSYHKVTVTVTDVDEAGSISLSAQQPQVGVDLTATLTDQDATDTDDEGGLQPKNGKWKWEQGTAMNGPWTLISGQTTGTYSSPTADTVGKYLRATATYTDAFGDDKTAMAVSAHAVRAKPAGTNSSPAFPDEDADTVNIQVSRSVNENSPPGTNVGEPVAAGDAGDILTYSLATPADANDNGKYRIDPATGQITVGARTMLNRESFVQDDPVHTVTVTATDPWSITVEADGLSATTQTVTITIKDVNEAPVITEGPTRAKQSENLTETDATPDNASDDVIVTTYTATDVEITEGDNACVVGSCTWSVSGADAGLFKVSNETATRGQLTFKKAPNYEKPSDSDKDNVYMVTVVVTDKGMDTERTLGVDKMTATRDVVITVANVKEDGKIKFSSNQPKQGVEFVATLTDDDGPTNVTKWKWERDENGSEGSPTDNCVDSLSWEDAEGEGAKTDTYTPEADDLGKCLRVTPTYTDPLGDSMVMENVSAKHVVVDLTNKAPEFKDANNKVITSTTRSVAEDAVTDDAPTPDVDSPVKATDPNETDEENTEILTYTLGGTDARYFEITDANSSTGQITVKEDTKLDYETKNSYMVTVTATDPSLASTTIDVTIKVKDVNEGPEFTAPKEGDVDVTVKENARSLNIYSFRATDPEGRTVYWSLDDDSTDSPDMSSFTISDKGALSLNTSPNYEDDGLGSDKTYTVVVIASDDALGGGIDTDGEDPIRTSMKTVTVTVEDVEENGAITTIPKYPHVTGLVTATLDDDDGETGTVTWEWKAGTAVVGTTSSSYTPVDADLRKTLSVKASYTQDGDGVTITKSAGTVRETPSPANTAPEFADTAENNARSVDENERAGTTLGKAIKATDADGDSLTYSLEGADASSFRISSSGQLSTAAVLNHEDDDGHSVTIRATDPWGGSGTIAVTVTVKDVNEAPMITTGPTRRDREENAADDALQVSTYIGSDVDEGDDVADLTWSIEGEDFAKFDIDESTGLLTFKESPDFEMPADRNKDNVYKVTVVVSDDGSPKLPDKRQVEVTVTDVEEDGEVTLSSVQPKVAIDLTASLEDSDGDVKDTAWQWYRSDTCPTALAQVGPALITALDGSSDWSEVPDAESETYTPEAGTAKDEGKCLLALAKYNDRRGTSKAAAKQSANVVIVNADNRAPMFKDNDQEITETTRKVAENTPNNEATDDGDTDDIDETTQGNIDDPVAAIDDDTLTYTLGGTDAASFDIDRLNGQLMTKAKLDYETKNSYMVTVTATDPDGLSDSVDVTIKVMDIDEAPEIIVGGLAITGLSAVSYAEDGKGNVATYMAAGPDAASATWSLSGADMGDFMISSTGVLTFRLSPDFETPADADTDNTYMVTVEANEGTNTAMKAVTIDVTNVDEDGTVSLSTQQPRVGTAIAATLTDADGGVTGTAWQWAKATTMDGIYSNIAGATSDSYTPVEGDANMYLRATAMYTDGHGSGKSEMTVSANAVNTVPAFDADTATRSVEENTAAGENIGEPIMATDDDTLTYTLSGTDAASFDIISATGQLQTKAALDYETKHSYTVTVTATDEAGLSDSIDVTITVTDVDDEAPVITGDPLVDSYDANSDGTIDRAEVGQAIRDFIGRQIEHDDVLKVIGQYFKDLRSGS